MKVLEGKVAVVTGASKGIGADIAGGMAAAGASVIVNYSADRAGAEAVAGNIRRAGGKAEVVQGDVREEHVSRALMQTAVDVFGRLDIVVNNAGYYHYQSLEEITVESFHQHFDVNLLGPILMMREAAALMGPEGGSIINIGSAAARAILPTTAIYSATKAALGKVTSIFAKELGPRNIRVNVIHPGAVETEGVRAAGLLGGEWERGLVDATPLGRIGQVDDITPVTIFLASDEARWITGEAIHVTGGF
ncbi:glucose 1-dehydrogenase [Sphingobium sp. TB-6]|uniref:SDR family NAD(P)-dependent oxidoreductase n=1 Tax=Sphingobium sp. TB-6 TaxID=2728850 RepID=UPI001469BD97|nr:glucose 1-dehydrogenase [Sphingobium sp. TB-6]NML90671.1 glucose 1-dehydrogenase [Sphingobium sp. TB-6]